jgi:hypothetical protein
MYLSIEGGTKKQRELIESFAVFAAYKLMSDKLADSIEVDIEITPKLFKEDGNIGDVIWEDKNHRPKQYCMRVDNSVKLRRVLETVAHEMTHISQFASGRWIEMYKSKQTKWEGKLLKKVPDYWDRPWEIEAHGREVGLFIQWVETMGYGDEPWTWDDLDKYKQAHE